jgi:molybdopterin molybdotransferase
MISPEEALRIIRTQNLNIETENCPLGQILNRTLAEDVHADMSMPPFHKSAMDGFACKNADLPGPLRIIETISAGTAAQKAINAGECIRLMTGCKIPDGADIVIKVEDVKVEEDHTINLISPHSAKNICAMGEDFQKGDLVLKKGTLIQSWHIAVLASVGKYNPLVYRKLKCGILSTGDELVEPDSIPAESQIRNSNGWQLLAQCQNAGFIPTYYGIIQDVPEVLFNAIQKSLEENDITLLTGGVSMGDFDFVPAMLKKAGVEILFEKIAVQPGSPTVFGRKGNRFVFGLPGNPVSTLTQFELLVRALEETIYNRSESVLQTRLPLAVDFQRKNTHRKAWFPVKIQRDGSIMPLNYHGSAHILGYNEANGIASVEAGQSIIYKGELTDVRFL